MPRLKQIPVKSASKAKRQPNVKTAETFRLPERESLHGIDVLKGDYDLGQIIELEALSQGVDPKVVRGMVRTESGPWGGEAVSGKGARGHMQLMSGTAKELGFKGAEDNLKDPKVNVALGVKYFKQQLEKYKGDVTKALAAYNAGPGNVDKYNGVPPFKETQDYVERVKGQSFQGGGEVGTFDRPVSPIRMKSMGGDELEQAIERALGKVLGNYATGGKISSQQIANFTGKNLNPNPAAAPVAPQLPPNPGQVGGAVGQLSSFQPLQGANQARLNQLAQTGAPVDVNPITQANIQQGQQQYNQLIAPQINEQMGALGLGSSSARTAALAQGASNVATNIGAEGLRAGVGAQENAAQRSLGAFSPLLGASGQQLSGLSTGAGIASTEKMQNAQLSQQGNQFQAGLNAQAAQFNAQNPLGSGAQTPLKPKFNVLGGTTAGGRYAQGGRVDEYDTLSNYLYGQTFNRPGVPEIPQFNNTVDSQMFQGRSLRQPAPARDPNAGLENEILAEQLRQLKIPQAGGRTPRERDPIEFARALVSSSGGRSTTSPEDLAHVLRYIGPEAAHRGLMQTGALLGSQSGSPASLGSMAAAGLPDPRGNRAMGYNRLPQMQKGGQVQEEYLMDSSEFDMGGQVDGPSVPPDRVHIMAQGGEGIIPVKMMHELENYNSNDPMVNEIKRLLFSGEKDKFATGGEVPPKRNERGKLLSPQAAPSAGGATAGQVAKMLKRLSPAELKKVKYALDPEGIGRFTMPGTGGVLDLPGLEGAYDPGTISAIRGIYPQAWPASVETPVVDPTPQFAGGGKVQKVMHEFKARTLHSGSASGPQVTDQDQAIAIAMSEQRKQKGYRGGGHVCGTEHHKMPDGSCMEDSEMYAQGGLVKRTSAFSSPGIPTNQANVRQPGVSGPAFGPSFTNESLAPYLAANPTTNPRHIDTGYNEEDELANAQIGSANEDRRMALYSMLMSTATAGARVKLQGLLDRAAGIKQMHDQKGQRAQEVIIQKQQLQNQQALAQQQMEMQQQNFDLQNRRVSEYERRGSEGDQILEQPTPPVGGGRFTGAGSTGSY